MATIWEPWIHSRIKLPVFDGRRENWAHFNAKFVTLVHSRTDLHDSVKASQLFSSVTDKALPKIAHYDPSEEDYERAWRTLLDFYDLKRIVADQHMSALLNLTQSNEG